MFSGAPCLVFSVFSTRYSLAPRVISFMHEDVQKDMFKLTMAELQRVVRLTLVPNKELSDLYGRSKPTDHNYWNNDWSAEGPDDQDGWGDNEESNT